MRAIVAESDIFGTSFGGPTLFPILHMFDIDGDVTDDLKQATAFSILLPDNSGTLVAASEWQVIDAKAN